MKKVWMTAVILFLGVATMAQAPSTDVDTKSTTPKVTTTQSTTASTKSCHPGEKAGKSCCAKGSAKSCHGAPSSATKTGDAKAEESTTTTNSVRSQESVR